MPTYEITFHGNGTATIEDVTFSEPNGTEKIFSVIAYVLGFIGLLIMLFCIPRTMLVFGIIAFLIYLLPAIAFVVSLIRDGDDFWELLPKCITPFASLLFNLLVAVFWIGYLTGTMAEMTIISLIIPSMYCMYFYPFILIRAAIKMKKVILGILAGVIIVASFAVLMAVYSTDIMLAIGLMQTSIIVLSTITILVFNLIYSPGRAKYVLISIAYGILALIVIITSVVMLHSHVQQYESAMQSMENGDYKSAREQFLALGDYEDAAEKYNSIRFTNLQVGESIVFGMQASKPNGGSSNPISWTVIDVKDGKALLLSDKILTTIDSPALFNLDNATVYNRLDYLSATLFSKSEIVRMQEYTYEAVRGDDVKTYTNKLFLPSRAELEKYGVKDYIFDDSDTSYNDTELVFEYLANDFDHDHTYSYLVRDAAEDGSWLIADCESDVFSAWNNKYKYGGIRPAIYINIDSVS